MNAIEARRHSDGGHGIHPYFGKVDPALAHVLIETHSKPGDVVLDPFCGSGTVLHEALLQGRHACGWDSSPLAVMIAAAKLVGTDEATTKELLEASSILEEHDPRAGLFFKPAPFEAVAPAMPRVRNIERWFSANALSELAWITRFIDGYECAPRTRLLLRTAFSRIVTRASNQQGESTYRCVSKPDYAGRIVELFRDSIRHVARVTARYETQRQLATHEKLTSFSWSMDQGAELVWGSQRATVEVSDARQHQSSGTFADLVVTSPPYLMSWDYGLYHKFRFYWLGLDLDSYEETEIGRHLRRRNDDLPRYTEDMTAAFRSLATAVHDGGVVAMINAPSVLHGRKVDTNAVLADCASDCFTLLNSTASLAIPGPHHGMYASLNARQAATAGESGKREHVLLFRKRS
jgi:hypothetical protein